MCDKSNHSQITLKQIQQSVHQNGCMAISTKRISVFRPNMENVITSMIWCYMQYFITVPGEAIKR